MGLSTPFLFLCVSLFLAQKAVIKYFVAYKMALLLENSISLQFLATAGFQQKPSGQGKFCRGGVGFSSKGTAAEKTFGMNEFQGSYSWVI